MHAAVKIQVRQTVTTHVTVESVFTIPSRLRRSCDREPGLYRERTKNGFRYRRPDGTLVRDRATLLRLKALAIPPAWNDIWICPAANGHLQATGRDGRGRKQYLYHPAFRLRKDTEKFARLADFGQALPRIRKRLQTDLARPGVPKEKVLAAIVTLLDQMHLRVGNVEYLKANKSFGLTTLLSHHLTIQGPTLRLMIRPRFCQPTTDL